MINEGMDPTGDEGRGGSARFLTVTLSSTPYSSGPAYHENRYPYDTPGRNGYIHGD